MNFKFIYEGLSRKITFSVLTVIQFTIGILCIYLAVETVGGVNKSISSMNRYFNNAAYYKIDSKMAVSELSAMDEEFARKNINAIKEIKDYFECNKDIELMSARSDEALIKKGKEISETVVTSKLVNFENADYIRVQGFRVNKKFLEKMNYEFLEGSIEEFNKDKVNGYIPVILGYIYKDKYKVGDIIESLSINENWEPKKRGMKVIGILSKDNYMHEGGISVAEKSLNNAILLPYDEFFSLENNGINNLYTLSYIELINYLKDGYVVLKDRESQQKINKDLLEFQFKFQLEDLNKSIKDYKNEVIEQLKPVIYMAIIVILFSIISVVIVMVNSIVKDKKEFGINIMMGATMKDIRIRVLGQVFLLFIISLSISSVILKSLPWFNLKLIDFSLTAGIMISILMIISLIIILNLNKYSINDLIRRNE